MPRIIRGQTGGLCTHVVSRGNGRGAVFHNEDDYAAFVELLGLACERVNMRVVACCLMPNHLHLVVWPREDGDLSRWMQWLMTSHVRRHHRRYDTGGHVWQGRYKSFVIQRRHPSASARSAGVVELGNPLATVVRYVERNPLRAGLVSSAERWAFSSLAWWNQPNSAPRWWHEVALIRPADWLDQVNRAESDDELAALRRCIARGRPFGTETWVKQTADKLGLQSTLIPRGRPRKD